jgi:hypothetical protein
MMRTLFHGSRLKSPTTFKTRFITTFITTFTATAMTALITLFFNIMRLKAAPQDLPCSRFLMLACIGSYLLVGIGVSLLDQSLGLALLSASIDTGLLIGLAYLALWIRNYQGRAVQTVTAFTGTGTLFELIGWPLVAWLQQTSGGTTSSLSLLLLLLIIWNIVVIGHILRHAVEIPMWVGSGVALMYVYTSIRVMVALQIAGAPAQ